MSRIKLVLQYLLQYVDITFLALGVAPIVIMVLILLTF